jgi:hypothetical protein
MFDSKTNLPTRILRKALGLPSQSQQVIEFKIEDGVLLSADQKQRLENRKNVDAEGWRGALAENFEQATDRLLNPKFAISRSKRNLKYHLKIRQAEKALAKAKSLVIESDILHNADDTFAECWLEIDGNCSMPVTVIALNAKRDYPSGWSLFRDNSSYIALEDAEPYFGERIYLAAESLNNDVIVAGIKDWYVDRFDEVHHHPSHDLNFQIEVSSNLEWSKLTQEEMLDQALEEAEETFSQP